MQIDEKGLAKALRVERAAWSADHSRDHGDSPSTASMRAAITAYLSTLSLGTRITLADGTEAVVVPAGLVQCASDWCEAVARNSSWDGWDHHFKRMKYEVLPALSALETK